MASASVRDMLHGRDAEAAAIGALLDGARGGRSGVLVLYGDAGIGKSALLDHAVAAAAGMAVLRSAGVEFEAELPYAGLQLLLRKAMGSLDALPAPQQRALRTAFGLSADGAAEPMFVGLAVLSLLAEHAGDGPLVCVVDDAQWLDRASVDALVFAARRLDAEGVVMLFAVRDGEGGFPAPGLPELRLGALADDAAAALLAEYGGALPDGVRRRILAEARGNPLALHELPATLRELPSALRESAAAGPGALPLTSRLQLAFHGRISHLPRGTQTLLLVAAADHTGDPGILVRAAQTLGVGVDDLPPAQDAGLVLIDDEDRLRFRHPLVRAAIHQRAPLPERLAAHRALAAACDPVLDPDHRAWHLAAAATGPDEQVAAALQQTAGRARDRSGFAAAAAAYERAARLSTDPTARAERLVLAAESASEAGELARARALTAEADRAAADAARLATAGQPVTGGSARHSAQLRVLRARTLHVRGLADFWQGEFPTAHRLLSEGAELAAYDDPQRAARMLVQAAHTAWYLGGEHVDATLDRLAALDLPPDAPTGPVVRFVTAALGSGAPAAGENEEDQADGAAAGPPTVDAAAAEARAAASTVGGRIDPQDLVMLCGVGLALGQDAQAHALAAVLAAETRELGGIGRLGTLTFFRAEAEIFASRPDEAYRTAEEGLRISRDTGQAQWVGQLSGALAHVAALRGDAGDCRTHADRALGTASGAATAPGAPWAYWSLGLLDLGEGRTQAALERLLLLADPAVRHQICATRSVPDLVEAAVRLGVPERADEPFARFERWAARSGQDWARALVERCRALRAADGDAERHYDRALGLHDPDRRALEAARTALLYGEWLRRARRTSEARGRLRTALDVFERVGARPWAARARAELTAAGAAVTAGTGAQREPSVAERAGLTPQETQIARLAAQGLSNKEIAAQLFLSPRTVGYHLYKAYPKLGVASRAELGPLFPPA